MVNRKNSPKTQSPVELFRNHLTAIRACIPWLPLSADANGRRPTINGTLTVIVVGNGQPTHTDRDGRVRVQFPWQQHGAPSSASFSKSPAGGFARYQQVIAPWLAFLRHNQEICRH